MRKWLQKLQIKGFVAGVILTILLSGVTAYAANRTQTITVTFRNIRIVMNGQVVTPRDAQGNVVEPFIWGGTTFLPLRAVADAVGMDASWSGSTNTAYLTSRTPVTPTPPPATPTPPPGTNAPNISTTSLANGNMGQAYNATLNAVGAVPITWHINSGSLPPGLSLNTNTGVISGTPTQAGTFNFVIRAQNQAGSTTVSLSLVIEQTLSTITLPNRRLTAAERTAWIADYTAMGGSTANEREIVRLINVERANRNLVQVSIDNSLMHAARFFAQQAHDLRNQHTGSHNFGPYATNPAAQHGASANVAAAFGGNLGNWNAGNWSSSGTISAADLVNSWMNSAAHRDFILAADHRFIGVGQFPGGISYLFMTAHASGTQEFTVTFNANGGTGTMAPQIFRTGEAQQLRVNTFVRTGYTFAGWRSTPTGPVQYVNMHNMTVTANRTLYAVWTSPATAVPVITTAATLTNAVAGTAFNQQLAANGGGITWTLHAGALPSGLSLSSAGLISGTTNTTGTFTFTIRATNTHGHVDRIFTLTVLPTGTGTATAAPNITTLNLGNGTVNTPYSQTISATGGGITFSVTGGQLPPGLSLNPATGAITGTPTQAGEFAFIIMAMNTINIHDRMFTISISAPGAGATGTPNITTNLLANGVLNIPYSQMLSATGGGIAWTLVDSVLPPGLSLNQATGEISGVPLNTGTFTFTVRATNHNGSTQRVFTIVVV